MITVCLGLSSEPTVPNSHGEILLSSANLPNYVISLTPGPCSSLYSYLCKIMHSNSGKTACEVNSWKHGHLKRERRARTLASLILKELVWKKKPIEFIQWFHLRGRFNKSFKLSAQHLDDWCPRQFTEDGLWCTKKNDLSFVPACLRGSVCLSNILLCVV